MRNTYARAFALLTTLAGMIWICASPAFASQDISYTEDPWKLDLKTPLFPSFILSTSMVKFTGQHVIGDPNSVVRIKITPNVANAQIKVVASVDGLARKSEYDGTLGPAGKTYTVDPTIRWKTERLLNMNEPEPDTVNVAVTLNGVSLGSKTKTVEVHAVNDVPFVYINKNGKAEDTSKLYAAFVNENSPVVEEILHEALRYGAVQHFVGYQRGPKEVEKQVFAVWNVLQRHHVTYSSIATPSVSSNRVYSQTVRFISQSWRSQQANCVDGSVLFASVLYKIGLDPVLVQIPGHMFVGYYMNPKYEGSYRDIQFLETTMVGNGQLPRPNSPPFSRSNPLDRSASLREFLYAVKFANHEYDTKALPGIRQHAFRYDIIDIKQARQMGITPISR